MDYVGAVYGSGSNQSFDGFLGETERAAVVSEFGELSPGSSVEPYLSAARKKFFLSRPQGDYCRDSSNFKMRKFSSPRWGRGIFLGTIHLCGAKIGEMFAEYEKEIVSHPEEWLLFTENYSDPMVKKAKGGESDLMQKVSRALNIPLEDPILPEPELARKIAEKYSVSVEDFLALFFLATMSGDRDVERQPAAAVRLFAAQWKADPEAIARRLLAIAKLPHKEIEKKVEEAVKRYDTVIAETSPEHIRAALTRHNKKKALFIVGITHLDLGPLVYGR